MENRRLDLIDIRTTPDELRMIADRLEAACNEMVLGDELARVVILGRTCETRFIIDPEAQRAEEIAKARKAAAYGPR